MTKKRIKHHSRRRRSTSTSTWPV